MNPLLSNPYQKVNAILAGILLLIFIYSAVFDYQKANHPIPSSQELIDGKDTMSTGLSRAFSAIMRGQVQEAKSLNPYSIQLFVFFGIMLLLRLLFVLLDKSAWFEQQRLIQLDAAISGGLFLVYFSPFIRETFQVLAVYR